MWKNLSRVFSTGTWSPSGRRLLSTATEFPGASRKESEQLYRRLSGLGKHRSVKKTLNEYIMEGKSPSKPELIACVRELRKYNQHRQALEIMEWMENRKVNFGYGDIATRLDLIAATKGISAAEEYMEGLSPSSKNRLTYGCLLNCYSRELMAEKALALFEKMDGMRILTNPLPFNNLMSMHLRLGRPEKVLELVEEMRSKGVRMDSFTYNMRMQAYSALDDLEGVERVVEEVRNDEDDKRNWTTYSNLATIYLKFGKLEKTESALKMLEAELRHPKREAYHFMISLYAGTSNLGEVHRVWNMLMTNFPRINNNSFFVLIPALSKLGDLDGLCKWVEEWKSTCIHYDVKIVNAVIKAYLEHDMYDQAASMFQDAMKRSGVKLFKARQMFMGYALKSHKLDLALEHLSAAVSECQADGMEEWQPKQETLNAFFDYVRDEKDANGADKLRSILEPLNLTYSDYKQS